MAKPGIHTVPHDGKWANERDGAAAASAVFEKQADAIDAAKKTAEREGLEHFIHGQDGAIRERTSYGNDPSSRPG